MQKFAGMHKYELVRFWQDIVANTHLSVHVLQVHRNSYENLTFAQHSSELVQLACIIAPTVHIDTYTNTHLQIHSHMCAFFPKQSSHIFRYCLICFTLILLLAAFLLALLLLFLLLFAFDFDFSFNLLHILCAFFLLPLLVTWQPAKTQIWLNSRHDTSATAIILTTYGGTSVKRVCQKNVFVHFGCTEFEVRCVFGSSKKGKCFPRLLQVASAHIATDSSHAIWR